MSNETDFTIRNNSLYKYIGYEKDVVIPENVTEIDAYAFRGKKIESVILPNGLQRIGHNAFEHCSELKTISIPESVVEIGDEAFIGCDGLADQNGYIILRGILFGMVWNMERTVRGVGADYVIPEGVTRIGRYAFKGHIHGKSTVQFPSSLKEIGELAFWNCIGIEAISIPDGVTSIGKECFQACYELKTVSIPHSVQTIGENAFDECPLDELFAPGTPITGIEGTKMKTLAVNAFMSDPGRFENAEIIASYHKYLITQKKKWLPVILDADRVDLLQIYSDAKKITAENIDAEYLTLASAAKATQCIAWLLEQKNRLTAGAKPKKQKKILEDDPFSPANMKMLWSYLKREDGTIELTDYKGEEAEVLIPGRIGDSVVTRLGSYLFSPEKPRRKKTVCETLRKIRKVIVSENVTEIGDNAFAWNSGITTIVFPPSLRKIENEAFSYCINLSADCFAGDTLDGVEIGKAAFAGCKNMANEEGLIIIDRVLYACDEGATTVQVPCDVTRIASGAFSYCFGVSDIMIPSSTKQIEDAFNTFTNFTIHAPAGSYAEQHAKEHNIPFVAE